MKKNYTFFFMHRYLFDAYWSLPIINYLSKSNNINLFFFYKNDFENFEKLLPTKNVKIHNIYKKDLIYNFYEKFIRILDKFNFINLKFLNMRLETLIKIADVIYLPYVRNQKFLDERRSSIIKSCKIFNKSIYLFPPVSSNILFNLPRNLNVKKVADFGKKLLKSKSEIKIQKQKYYESKNLSLDSSKALKYLNWKTHLNSKEALKLAFEWYKFYYQKKNIKKVLELTFDQIKNYKNRFYSKFYEKN